MGPRRRAYAQYKKRNGGSQNSSPAAGTPQNSNLSLPALGDNLLSRGPSNRNRGVLNDWQDYSDSNTPQNLPWSMAQSAKNTERHAMAWGSSRLRDQRITFVSAGNLRQEEIDAAAEERDESKDQKSEEEPLEEPKSGVQVEQPPDLPDPKTKQPEVLIHLPAEPILRIPPTRKDSISSQSSEEILFAGRRNPGLTPSTKTTPAPSKPATPQPGQKSRETGPPIATQLATPEITAQDSSSSGLEKFEKILSSHQENPHSRRGRARQQKKDEEEALMKDYIANMTLDDPSDDNIAEAARSVKTGRRTEHFRFFDSVTEPKVKLQSQHTRSTANKKPRDINQALDWDSADLEDFDNFSTTDEEVVEIKQVLRSRTRPSGLQYLVNPLGKGANTPRWVLHDKLTSGTAVEEIRIFQEIQLIKIQETTPESEDSDFDDEDEDDLNDEIDSEEEENERILKHASMMTDEQIARALAKQEELGLGSDELLLLDGNFDDMDDLAENDEFASGEAFIGFSTQAPLSNRTTSKRNRRRRDNFPSASAFADALDQDPYGAFDVMDFDRPSLRPTKKGRKADLPFDVGVDDPELADRLRSTWEKDREKKTARKREKQAEREDALFEASERNQPAAIKAEIRQFLVQEVETLELAPMDATQRAGIHRLAVALKLSSKSSGKEGHGKGRFVVLSKGSRTARYTNDNIWEIDALLDQRKYFPKHAFGPSRGLKVPGSKAAKVRRGGGGLMSGVSYMNGDVVGASAPEIGIDNKGRAMLERMGWTGQGLGALGNEGSVDVIKHVVKTTKAGLG